MCTFDIYIYIIYYIFKIDESVRNVNAMLFQHVSTISQMKTLTMRHYYKVELPAKALG